MKKTFLLVCVFCLSLYACKESEKPLMTLDQVNESWKTVPLKVAKNADVKDMVKAFQKQWPTESVAALLKDIELSEDDRQYISEYDPQQGFMSFAEGSDDRDSETMEARVWKRSNGHQLFSIALSRPSTEVQTLVAFYDYDPDKKTLTPEPDVFTPCPISFVNEELGYELYPEGEEMVAYEYFFNWWSGLRHVYQWNGMTFDGPVTEFEGINNILEEFNQNYMTYEMGDFTKYALVDIDEDGEPELWLSTENEEYQTVLSIVEGEIKMIAGKDFKRHLLFLKDIVGDAGGCGTGCFYAHYTKLLNSAVEFEFEDMQSYNFQTDDMDHQYAKNDELLTEEEGEALFDTFGEVLDAPEVEWRPFR